MIEQNRFLEKKIINPVPCQTNHPPSEGQERSIMPATLDGSSTAAGRGGTS
jgi:hypothetical protein